MVPTVKKQPEFNARLDIVPISKTSPTPTTLKGLEDRLPTGSVLLTNKTDKPIMAVTLVWNYTDEDGSEKAQWYSCNGYLKVPAAAVIHAQASALLTTSTCAAEDLFPQMLLGRLLGSPLSQHPGDRRMSQARNIEVSIDSVFYQDGEVVGPDTKQRLQDLLLTDQARREVANIAGEEQTSATALSNRMASMEVNARTSRDRLTQLQGRWASVVKHSSNPSATASLIKNAPALPTFYRGKGN